MLQKKDALRTSTKPVTAMTYPSSFVPQSAGNFPKANVMLCSERVRKMKKKAMAKKRGCKLCAVEDDRDDEPQESFVCNHLECLNESGFHARRQRFWRLSSIFAKGRVSLGKAHRDEQKHSQKQDASQREKQNSTRKSKCVEYQGAEEVADELVALQNAKELR